MAERLEECEPMKNGALNGARLVLSAKPSIRCSSRGPGYGSLPLGTQPFKAELSHVLVVGSFKKPCQGNESVDCVE